jgi:hypothetical protein
MRSNPWLAALILCACSGGQELQQAPDPPVWPRTNEGEAAAKAPPSTRARTAASAPNADRATPDVAPDAGAADDAPVKAAIAPELQKAAPQEPEPTPGTEPSVVAPKVK